MLANSLFDSAARLPSAALVVVVFVLVAVVFSPSSSSCRLCCNLGVLCSLVSDVSQSRCCLFSPLAGSPLSQSSSFKLRPMTRLNCGSSSFSLPVGLRELVALELALLGIWARRRWFALSASGDGGELGARTSVSLAFSSVRSGNLEQAHEYAGAWSGLARIWIWMASNLSMLLLSLSSSVSPWTAVFDLGCVCLTWISFIRRWSYAPLASGDLDGLVPNGDWASGWGLAQVFMLGPLGYI